MCWRRVDEYCCDVLSVCWLGFGDVLVMWSCVDVSAVFVPVVLNGCWLIKIVGPRHILCFLIVLHCYPMSLQSVWLILVACPCRISDALMCAYAFVSFFNGFERFLSDFDRLPSLDC